MLNLAAWKRPSVRGTFHKLKARWMRNALAGADAVRISGYVRMGGPEQECQFSIEGRHVARGDARDCSAWVCGPRAAREPSIGSRPWADAPARSYA
jgi:hypothetical protein